MRTWTSFALCLLLAAPAAAFAQYEAIANPPDPAAQLAEMLAIYDEVCLHAFPDDDGVASAMAARGATPLSRAQVRAYLHDDPGRGWRITGRTTWFDLTIEAPPFHACGLRTMTADGFPDMKPYRDLAARFEGDGGFQAFGPVEMDVGNVHVAGAGEQRATRSGGEALLVFRTVANEADRARGNTAVEVRFTHQFSRR